MSGQFEKQVYKFGSSIGILLPKHLCKELNIEETDLLYVDIIEFRGEKCLRIATEKDSD